MTISIAFFLLIYNVSKKLLSECIDSVLNQSYDNFEICVADDNSSNDETINTLKDYDIYLEKYNWCNQAVDVEDYKCSSTINDYVGLLSTSDYLQAGGKNSYLNNETYFWTINKDSENNVYLSEEAS